LSRVKFRAQAEKSYTNRILHKRYLSTSPHWAIFTANEKHDEPVRSVAQTEMDEDGPPEFAPITSMHMHSNPALVRARIVKVLRARPAHTIAHSDVIHAINLTPVQTIERRKLNRMIDAMAEDGIILKGLVPSKAGSMAVVQLVKGDRDDEDKEDVQMAEASAEAEDAMSGSDIEPLDLSRLRYTLPVERQVLDVIQNAGDEGVIIRVCPSLS
jgi:hypothetical protein